ncbi:MAG: VOC family protein [Minwuia sp.]|uniref:VOC family protein n=1 Tax=Minwuia sp. TaxID=2493630 RepID=UPI003A8806BD
MIDHVSVQVRDLKRAADFYRKVFAPMGFEVLADRPATVGFGKRYPEFWLNARPDSAGVAADTGYHVCLRARDRETVDAFHRIALAEGAVDDGAPGERQGQMTVYYGAFIRDPDGNRIEVVTFPRD